MLAKDHYQLQKLNKGEVYVYELADIKLHAYKTNDLLQDEVFILEKQHQGIMLESPCFQDNIAELSQYVQQQHLNLVGKIISYHCAGGSSFADVPVYSTHQAENYATHGAGKQLVRNFAESFGKNFDASGFQITHYLTAGIHQLAGITLNIQENTEAFDIDLPDLQSLYTHMLGHDCHSIVAGMAHAQHLIQELQTYIQQNYALILTAHYTPEDLGDVRIKIAYLQQLQQLANTAASAKALQQRMQQLFPSYQGNNYLEMTAKLFYPEV